MTKKLFALLLAICMLLCCFSFVACNNTDSSKDISNYQGFSNDEFGNLLYNKNLFYTNSIIQGGADPDVFDDTSRSGYYYLYVTEAIWRSKNLTDWEEVGKIFNPTVQEEKDVLHEWRWAPEVVYDEDMQKYVMFFSSTAKEDKSIETGKGITSGNGYCILHVATSDVPQGPFQIVNFKDKYNLNTTAGIELTQEQVDSNEYAWVKEGDKYYQAAFTQYFADYALLNPEEMYKMLQPYGNLTNACRNGWFPRDTIDPHPFVDPVTGNKYLHCTLGKAHAMMVVKMTDWLTPDFSEAAITIVQNYYTVEDAQNNSSDHVTYETQNVNEGPHVLYHEDKNGKGLYYLTYSMNAFTASIYQVGTAVAESPIGPFRKLHEEEGALMLCSSNTDSTTISGAGHHSFITVGDQNFIVYHRHNDYEVGGDARYTAIDEYKWLTVKDIYGNDMDIPYTNGPTDSLQPLPEAHSDYRNVADEATVSANKKDVDTQYLNDGLLAVYKSGNETFSNYIKETEITQKTTFSFKFGTPLTARAVMVYNSVEEEYVFTNIDLIELVGTDGSVKTIHNVKFDTERYCDYGGEEGNTLWYCRSGTAAFAEFYDTKVKEVRVTMSVPQGQDAVRISEIRILGKNGEPTYVGEGDYSFTNQRPIIADVDEGMTLDGDFSEEKWSQVKWLKAQDYQSETQYADIEFTMWYGQNGVFFGMIVKETGANIYHNPLRTSYYNSCIEMYMGPADAPANANTIFEFDFCCDSSVTPRLYNDFSGLERFVVEGKYMPVSVAKPLGGAINTPECYGYQIEAMFPYEYLRRAGYDVDNIDDLVLAINPVHIWSFNYDGTDLSKDRLWSDWAQQYISAGWLNPSTWFKFGKDGLLAHDYNVSIEGPVTVRVSGSTSKLGVVLHEGTASITLKVVNASKNAIKSITVNGKEFDLSSISWSGSSGTFYIYNVTEDIDIVVTTQK